MRIDVCVPPRRRCSVGEEINRTNKEENTNTAQYMLAVYELSAEALSEQRNTLYSKGTANGFSRHGQTTILSIYL